ncbi:hypothetical protein [Lignipirellula cremea]|uniref:Uncharacterized protein n=1 Tax=Lignipirellula cremea TaxID=2528010 RepID=A0A518E193_9BACT|nr:hypothetical protein [Lignipirellula cremea]QDU97877.1 hypothetical protein Pla8534_57340 [Lignipirellula cremea]
MNANNGFSSDRRARQGPNSELQELEQITAPLEGPEPTLSPAAAELRAAWTSLGRQLDQAASDFDPDLFLSRLQNPSSRPVPVSGQAKPLAKRSPHGGKRDKGKFVWPTLLVSGALIAALLLTAVNLGQFGSLPWSENLETPAQIVEHAAPPAGSEETPGRATWDDDLDLRFEQVGLSIQEAQEEIAPRWSPGSRLDTDLQQLENDLDAGSF